MSINSNIQVSHTFIIIGLIAESTLKFINDSRTKILGNLILWESDLILGLLAISDPYINICVGPPNTCIALKQFHLLPPNTSV